MALKDVLIKHREAILAELAEVNAALGLHIAPGESAAPKRNSESKPAKSPATKAFAKGFKWTPERREKIMAGRKAAAEKRAAALAAAAPVDLGAVAPEAGEEEAARGFLAGEAE
jgi:hypothetical protein